MRTNNNSLSSSPTRISNSLGKINSDPLPESTTHQANTTPLDQPSQGEISLINQNARLATPSLHFPPTDSSLSESNVITSNAEVIPPATPQATIIEFNELKKFIKETEDRIFSLDGQIRHNNNSVLELNVTINKIKANIESIEIDIKFHQQTKETGKAKTESADKRIAECNGEKARFEKEKTQCEKNITILKEKNESINAQLNVLSEKVKDLKLQAETITASFPNIEKETTSLNLENKKFQRKKTQPIPSSSVDISPLQQSTITEDKTIKRATYPKPPPQARQTKKASSQNPPSLQKRPVDAVSYNNMLWIAANENKIKTLLENIYRTIETGTNNNILSAIKKYGPVILNFKRTNAAFSSQLKLMGIATVNLSDPIQSFDKHAINKCLLEYRTAIINNEATAILKIKDIQKEVIVLFYDAYDKFSGNNDFIYKIISKITDIHYKIFIQLIENDVSILKQKQTFIDELHQELKRFFDQATGKIHTSEHSEILESFAPTTSPQAKTATTSTAQSHEISKTDVIIDTINQIDYNITKREELQGDIDYDKEKLNSPENTIFLSNFIKDEIEKFEKQKEFFEKEYPVLLDKLMNELISTKDQAILSKNSPYQVAITNIIKHYRNHIDNDNMAAEKELSILQEIINVKILDVQYASTDNDTTSLQTEIIEKLKSLASLQTEFSENLKTSVTISKDIARKAQNQEHVSLENLSIINQQRESIKLKIYTLIDDKEFKSLLFSLEAFMGHG